MDDMIEHHGHSVRENVLIQGSEVSYYKFIYSQFINAEFTISEEILSVIITVQFLIVKYVNISVILSFSLIVIKEK